MIQQLKLHLTMQGAWVQFPVRELRSHMPWRVAKNLKRKRKEIEKKMLLPLKLDI